MGMAAAETCWDSKKAANVTQPLLAFIKDITVSLPHPYLWVLQDELQSIPHNRHPLEAGRDTQHLLSAPENGNVGQARHSIALHPPSVAATNQQSAQASQRMLLGSSRSREVRGFAT